MPDTDLVYLNERGRQQAEAMATLFSKVTIDRALHSGLRRTRETAEIVLQNRTLAIGEDNSFSEIRPLEGGSASEYDLINDVAFSHWRADEDGARFLGGETYQAFYDRIVCSITALVADPTWRRVAVFAHGGTNAAILGWVSGIGLRAFGMFDQATCCLNVIDIDVSSCGDIVRKSIRGTNITAHDPTKSGRHTSDMEAMAGWLQTARQKQT